MNPCPHYAPRVDTGAWTLETEGIYAGLWVHGADDCRRPSRATLARVLDTDPSEGLVSTPSTTERTST